MEDVRPIDSEFWHGLIVAEELNERPRKIRDDPSHNKHNLVKAFRAGLIMDRDCDDERLPTARKIAQEVDSGKYEVLDSPNNDAFGVSPKASE